MLSTHTSRVGCDFNIIGNFLESNFLLTHPVWDVTGVWFVGGGFGALSTHTSRVGCDGSHRLVQVAIRPFYSHIPCGM